MPVTLEDAERAVDRVAVRYDKDGDQHYDVASAFIKSIRGSDVDAALHYLARMLEAGEDPRFVARRIVISASEDIGEADPSALPLAVAAAQAVQLIGMPEAQDRARPGRGAPRAGAEVERLLPRDRRGLGRRPRRAGRAGAAAPARRPLPGRGPARATGRATGTPTTTRGASSSSSTPPTPLADRTYYTPTDRGFERELPGGRLRPSCAALAARPREVRGDRVAPAASDRALRREVPPMSIGELAGLIAALAFVLLVGFLGYPLYKLGKVFDETRLSVHDISGEPCPLLEEVTTTVTTTNGAARPRRHDHRATSPRRPRTCRR